MVFSLLLLLSLIHSSTQQLISNYWGPTTYQTTFKVLILFSFFSFPSFLWSFSYTFENRRQVERKTPFIRILYSHFVCFLFCSLPAALLPRYVFTYYFLALGSIPIVCSGPEWLLIGEHFIENFEFQPQKCCSGYFIEENFSLFRHGSLRLLTWKLLKF